MLFNIEHTTIKVINYSQIFPIHTASKVVMKKGRVDRGLTEIDSTRDSCTFRIRNHHIVVKHHKYVCMYASFLAHFSLSQPAEDRPPQVRGKLRDSPQSSSSPLRWTYLDHRSSSPESVPHCVCQHAVSTPRHVYSNSHRMYVF